MVVVHVHVKFNREPSVGRIVEVDLCTANGKVTGPVVVEIALQRPLLQQNVLDVEIGAVA